MAEPILEVQNVSKLFGSVIALSNVSARVYPGEVAEFVKARTGADKVATLGWVLRRSAAPGENEPGSMTNLAPSFWKTTQACSCLVSFTVLAP